jgi:predicted nucleotidyltransferase
LQRKKSDIDLFIEFQRPIGLDFVDLTEHIEDVLGRKVDAITPEGIKGIRVKEIANSIKRGIIYV